jgi:hypothetical protein
MKVKELLKMLNGIDPEADVKVFCNGGIYDSSLDGTEDMNDGEVPDEFCIAAETT